MSSTPKEPERAKNGGTKLIAAKTSNSLIAAPSLSADEMVKWWRAFRRFIADVDRLLEYYDDLREIRLDRDGLRTVAGLEEDAEWCQKLVAKCKAGFERFDPPHNYEEDEEDAEADKVLKTTPIAARLGMMIAAFPEHILPQSSELFACNMIKHVADIDYLSMPALETACREIERTEKWPDLPKVFDIISEHVDQWNKRRWALGAERLRRELIPILTEREQKKKKEAHEREFQQAIQAAREAMRTTQKLAKEIEAAKAALAKEIETRNAALAALVQKHFEAEQRESECMRTLRKLSGAEEEEQAATAKLDGAGLPLNTLH